MEPQPVKYEDERRWLLLDPTADITPGTITKVETIVQFYTPVASGSHRFRESYETDADGMFVATNYTTTWKGPKQGSRGPELERFIDRMVYEMELPNSIGKTEKIRTTIEISDWKFEHDHFTGDCAGLVIVELEFTHPEELAPKLVAKLHAEYMALELPECFGRNIEITGDSAYSNYQLATHGIPESFYTYCSS